MSNDKRSKKEEFAMYVIAVMEAWAKGETIEYRELLSHKPIWRNIEDIPPEETTWIFEYREFRIKPKYEPFPLLSEAEIKGISFMNKDIIWKWKIETGNDPYILHWTHTIDLREIDTWQQGKLIYNPKNQWWEEWHTPAEEVGVK